MGLNIVLSRYVVNPGHYNEVHVESVIGHGCQFRRVVGSTENAEMRVDYGYSGIPGPYSQRLFVWPNLQEEAFLRVTYEIRGLDILVYSIHEASDEEIRRYG